RRPPLAHHRRILFRTLGNLGEGDVGDLEERAAQRLLDGGELALELSDRVAKIASLRDQFVGALLRLLALGDFLRVRVALGLSLFDRMDQRAAVAVQRDAAVDDRREGVEHAAAAHAVAQRVQVLAKYARVVHGISSWECRRRTRKTRSWDRW